MFTRIMNVKPMVISMRAVHEMSTTGRRLVYNLYVYTQSKSTIKGISRYDTVMYILDMARIENMLNTQVACCSSRQ